MNNVLLIDHESEKPKDDFRLTRLCEWGGFQLSDFSRLTIPIGQDPDWQALNSSANVLVPLGPRATDSFAIPGGVATGRGYLWSRFGRHVIPTVSPGFIQRGNAKYSAAFINDLKKAVQLAEHGLPVNFTSYRLDPSPLSAYEWAKDYIAYLAKNPATYLAFDIETPGKDEDEEELDGEADRTWNIDRIGFSYKPLGALSIPWSPEYFAAIKMLLGTSGPKVVWNAGFDVPRVRRAGVDIKGVIHDGMVAWHILHSDLPKRLGFVATFTCPWQPAWKHLSGAKPAFYNATDADVELRSMLVIESELRKTGLWDVYQKDVLDLEPILVHMSEKGMPVDAGIRLDRAIKLDTMLKATKQEMETLVPLEARRIAIVYKKDPTDVTGCITQTVETVVKRCSHCGVEGPPKSHFKSFKRPTAKRPQNPCADAVVVEASELRQKYARLAEFTPSRDQLIRYHEYLNRPCPRTYDKKERKQKISFAEKQLKELRLKYPDDKLYQSVLEYRSLDKLAGSYLGRPVEETNSR